jgi:hypothetical protein
LPIFFALPHHFQMLSQIYGGNTPVHIEHQQTELSAQAKDPWSQSAAGDVKVVTSPKPK